MSEHPHARADRQDIAELLVRYATAIDTRDWPLLRTCFSEDVVAEYEGIATWTDIAAMTDFMVAAHREMGHTLHQLSNIAVDVSGEGATARCYVDAVLMARDGAAGLRTIGFYDDELVRGPDGWRIARRHFTMVHVEPLSP